MRRFHVWMASGILATLVGLPAPASAQGFSVNEHSTCAMGRAGAAVAAPCADGSAMVFNPAGLASLGKGTSVVSVGGTFIAPSGSFTDDATGLESKLNKRVFPVPALFMAHGFTDKIAAGVGVYAPYGLETDWPTSSQGRFSSYRSNIRNIYLQPTVAVKLGRMFKVGAGFDVNFMHLKLAQRADLSAQLVPGAPVPGLTFAGLGIPTGTDFADIDIAGGKTGFGYHVGAMFEPHPRISFGVRYLSRQKVEGIEGDVKIRQIETGILLPASNPLGLPAGTPLDQVVAPQFSGVGVLADQKGTTDIRLPEQLTLGTAIKVTDKFSFMFDYTMTNWEVWEAIVLDFDRLPTTTLPQNFEKAHAFRFGGEYGVGANSVVRAGYITHGAAAPDETVTPTLPEGARAEFTVGFGTRLSGKGKVDLAYQYIDQADRRGRTGAHGTPNNGLYKFNAHLFGATFTWTF
jgi:long-chain fatty acid transport protein